MRMNLAIGLIEGVPWWGEGGREGKEEEWRWIMYGEVFE